MQKKNADIRERYGAGLSDNEVKFIRQTEYECKACAECTGLPCKKEVSRHTKYEINIAEMQVGRKEVGGEAVMVLKVDSEIVEDAVCELLKDEKIYTVKAVKL